MQNAEQTAEFKTAEQTFMQASERMGDEGFFSIFKSPSGKMGMIVFFPENEILPVIVDDPVALARYDEVRRQKATPTETAAPVGAPSV